MHPLFIIHYVRIRGAITPPISLYTNTSEERGCSVCIPLQKSQSPGLRRQDARDSSVGKDSGHSGCWVRQRADLAGSFVAQFTHVVWTLAVNLHVVRDVSSTKELPTDVTGDLLLVPHHVRSQAVLRSEGSFTGLAFKWTLRRMNLSDVTVQMIRTRESFSTVAANVGLVHRAIMGAHVIRHPVLALEALLTHVAGVGLLVRVRQLVAVQVVDISEGFAAHLAGVVLAHLLGRGGGPRHGKWQRGRRSGHLQGFCTTSECAGNTKQTKRHHRGHFNGSWLCSGRFGARVDRFMPSEVVAIFELF